MSSKKSGFGTTVLVILVIALIFAAAATILYVTGMSPEFNKTVDVYLGKKQEAPVEHTSIERNDELAFREEPVTEGPVTVVATEITPVSSTGTAQLPVSVIDYLKPTPQAAKLILAGFKNWSGDISTVLPELSFFYPRNGDGSWSLPVDNYETRLIPFSPDEQGMYTIGLSEKRGGWIQALAFVAVFEETGELLAVSVDYHSDRPQVSLHLRDDRMYYIAQGFFTDENPIPENTVLCVQESL